MEITESAVALWHEAGQSAERRADFMRNSPVAALPPCGATDAEISSSAPCEETATYPAVTEQRSRPKGRPLKSITTATLKTRRIQHGIAGHIICRKLGWARSKLTALELGYIQVPPEELDRVSTVLDHLIQTKAAIRRTATSLGWPGAEAAL